MSKPVKLAKATMQELASNFENVLGHKVTVQFNPESLKVSFANQVQPPGDGRGAQSGSEGMQFVGAGTTKLAVQLWFDVNAEMPADKSVNDVRKLTQEVAYFITPKKADNQPNKFIPPAVRFLWGSFQFDGIMESMEESLGFFSDDGRPLRASVSFTLTQQKIKEFTIHNVQAQAGTNRLGGNAPGTQPMTPAPKGSSVPSMADKQGLGGDWQGIAAANGIENPRLLEPGQLINLNVSASVGSGSGSLNANIQLPTVRFS